MRRVFGTIAPIPRSDRPPAKAGLVVAEVKLISDLHVDNLATWTG